MYAIIKFYLYTVKMVFYSQSHQAFVNQINYIDMLFYVLINLAKDVRQNEHKPVDPPKPPPCPPPPPMNIPVPPPMRSHTTIPPPPIPGLMPAPDGAMTIKRKHVTKYKLPTLNWMPLKPNQVRYE